MNDLRITLTWYLYYFQQMIRPHGFVWAGKVAIKHNLSDYGLYKVEVHLRDANARPYIFKMYLSSKMVHLLKNDVKAMGEFLAQHSTDELLGAYYE